MKIDENVNNKSININSFLKEFIFIFIKSKINNLVNLINSLISILFINRNDLKSVIILNVFFLIIK